ncbi:hypothetical protein [Rubrolithibacter danxiaensis]|uniref:hypothetical protein n=1 Tax=Rubrolithibacter danxiaensis TaxID=3390805 RepID=UPI003BF8563C
MLNLIIIHPKNTGTISLLSIFIAWSVGIAYFDIRENLVNGKVVDLDFVMFWSAIAILIAWAIFIYIPLSKINHSSALFKLPIFPIVTTLYALTVFFLIIGWVFFNSRFTQVFEIAAVVGFFFGVVYLYFYKRDGIFSKIDRKILLLIPFLYLSLFLTISLWLFPKILPSIAFRYMPDTIQENIIKETIPKYKVGDSFEALNNALPSYFSDSFSDGFGSTMVQLGEFKFVIEVKCNIIARVDYTYDKNKLYSITAIPAEDQHCR